MTLTKAIETNEETIRDAPNWAPHPKIAAIKLGNEAMKLIKSSREWNPTIPYKLLPGETEE